MRHLSTNITMIICDESNVYVNLIILLAYFFLAFYPPRFRVNTKPGLGHGPPDGLPYGPPQIL